VDRSLDTARSRAEGRAQRFLDAASQLTREHQGTDFTVQDVVERSGQSLRSFYQYFDGKQELLYAVYEEALRASTAQLRELVLAVDNPMERLHCFVVTLYAWCEREVAEIPAPNALVRAMSDFAFRLVATEPARAAAATEDLFALTVELLDGALGPDPEPRRRARHGAMILQTVMFTAFGTSAATGTAEERAEEMWRFCVGGISGGRRPPA